jgi:YfiH family protein
MAGGLWYGKGVIVVIHKQSAYAIFFGDAQSCSVERGVPEYNDFCKKIVSKIDCKQLVIQHQIHGTDGQYIDKNTLLSSPVSLELEGDYLITDVPGIAIGILTADCLPVVFYDKRNQVVAVAHAGWKGSFGEIVIKTIKHMHERHACKPEDLQIFFGPAAGVCCYQVQEDFLRNMPRLGWQDKVVVRQNEKIFFNLSLFNKLLLVDIGITPAQIDTSYNHCTICNHAYHSNRRNGHARLVQLTAVWLK